MKLLLLFFCTGLTFLCRGQNSFHYEEVYNVYRKDKSTIIGYSKEFISMHHKLISDNDSVKGELVETDSGIALICNYSCYNNIINPKVTMLAKDNRTKISFDLSQAINTQTKDCTMVKMRRLFDSYKRFLKQKDNDKANW